MKILNIDIKGLSIRKDEQGLMLPEEWVYWVDVITPAGYKMTIECYESEIKKLQKI